MAQAKATLILPKAVLDGIYRTLDPFVDLKANGEGRCSRKTKDERLSFYPLMVAQLWEMGFRIRRLDRLQQKHVAALMKKWADDDIVAGTLHTRLSMMKFVCDRLDKKNVVQHLSTYLPKERTRRCTVSTESKAWEENGVNPLEIIDLARTIDERLAVILALQHFFGLRVKESIELRPGSCIVEGGTMIELHEGTKGGRPRQVAIKTDDQQDVLEWARLVASKGVSKRLRWTDCTWKQAQRRFYHLIGYRLGITRALAGISAHCLRHGYAQRRYRQVSGFPSPVQGGALGKIDRQTHEDACNTVTRELGHGRRNVTPTYYGSYGHALRAPAVTSMTMSFKGLNLPT